MPREDLIKLITWTMLHYGSNAGELANPGSKLRSQATHIADVIEEYGRLSDVVYNDPGKRCFDLVLRGHDLPQAPTKHVKVEEQHTVPTNLKPTAWYVRNNPKQITTSIGLANAWDEGGHDVVPLYELSAADLSYVQNEILYRQQQEQAKADAEQEFSAMHPFGS